MKFLPIAVIAMLLQGTAAAQRVQPASIEGVVVKTGAADIRLQFSLPEGAIRSNEKVTSGVGDPIPGVTVELTGISGDRVRTATFKTGRDGRFEFRNIVPGEGYQLIAVYSPEYLPAQYGQRYPGQSGTPISLVDGQQLKDVRITMTRAGGISGMVLDSGKPWSGPVYAIKPFYEEGRRVLGSMAYGKTGIAGTVIANKKGEYSFSGLIPGQYYVCLGTKGQNCSIAPVNLRAGDSVRGVNIDFMSMNTHRVIGDIVSRVTGLPVSAKVGMTPVDAVPNPPESPLRNSSARFAATVNPGSYFLIAASNENGVRMFGYKRLELGASDYSQARIVVEPDFMISGKLTGDFPRDAVVRLRALIPGMPESPTAVVANDGTFTLLNATPGEYRVGVTTPQTEGTHLKSIRFGGRELADGILRIERHSSEQLEVSVGMNSSVVNGRVLRIQNGEQTAAGGIRVVIVPDVSHRSRFDLYKDVFTNDAGTFVLRGIAPGSYKVFAWELVQDGAWQDPEFIRIYESLGKPLRVTEGSRNSVEVELIPPWN